MPFPPSAPLNNTAGNGRGFFQEGLGVGGEARGTFSQVGLGQMGEVAAP